MEYKKFIHNERCPKCKEAVRKFLEKIYGKVESNCKFEIGVYPEDFKNTPYYEKLKKIYVALQNHRGFREFVRAKTLPNCDFFIHNPGFIVEFDESQHFTLPRKLALEHYPEEITLGFDTRRWISLCEKIDAKDNDPPYRDEQRAWYDTLRDFLPIIRGLNPTTRIFACDFAWCCLDQANLSDVKKFETITGISSEEQKIEVRKDFGTPVARIIIDGNKWDGQPKEAKELMEAVCERWPEGRKSKFLITCGGFIQFDWPKSIPDRDIGDNKYPNSKVVDTLYGEAEETAKFVLADNLCSTLGKFTEYITLGIDSSKDKISITRNYISQYHVELVLLIDLKNKKIYRTGKSYPTGNQQESLVRISDLKTHFFELSSIGKVMVLGCHDLTVFNLRSKNAKGWRKKVNEEFVELAKKEKPIYVLHHPHTTVKTRTWLNAWNNLRRTLPSVEGHWGAGRYDEPGEDLMDVLKSTKCGNSVDFVAQKDEEGGWKIIVL